MSFEPYYNKIEVRPLEKESPIASVNPEFIEAGEVVSVGRDVEGFAAGDIVFFQPYGCSTTAEYNGEKHYVVTATGEFILGKYVAGK